MNEALNYVKESKVVNTDETGWRKENKHAWLWTVVADWLSVFSISKHRDKKTLQEILEKEIPGSQKGEQKNSSPYTGEGFEFFS